jgi:hypothetical protein
LSKPAWKLRCGPRPAAVLTVLALAAPGQALAWGNEGHEVIAAIAQSYLTPVARRKIDALLAADSDTLTATDLLSRSTWADAWRAAGHRETAKWHYVDIEVDRPDQKAACFGYPATNHPASAGPAQDCVIDRVDAFAAELADPTTPEAERILALKYVLHFVGDLHQPLHAADNHDRGGNCLRLALGGSRTTNLHSYWDKAVVEALGSDPRDVAAKLRAEITPAQASAWRRGTFATWAMETHAVATATAYWPGAPAGCDRDAAPVSLPAGYDARAREAASLQLRRAGIRLAVVLNRALSR